VGPPEPRPKLTKGQREQVEALYQREADDLYKYACSISRGGRPEPQELLHRTFEDVVRAWRQVGLLGPDARRKWLRRVLKNKAIDEWRKPKVIALTADVPHPHSRSDDPAEHAEFGIALAACWGEIKQMPPMRQEVAFLVWGESWTPAQVAKYLGLADSTVRGHLREARKQLRTAVGPLVSFIDDEEEQEPAP
jgi:RNA polymerase sigma-70 factor, ECF subfamily